MARSTSLFLFYCRILTQYVVSGVIRQLWWPLVCAVHVPAFSFPSSYIHTQQLCVCMFSSSIEDRMIGLQQYVASHDVRSTMPEVC